MRLSTKGRYGLRAVVDLATYQGDGPVSLQSIAKRQDLSEKYLEQILGLLRKGGIVKSVRGTQGGYLVNGDLADVSVGDILRALEGDLAPVECGGLVENGECQNSGACVTKYVWKKMNDAMENTVNQISLKELVEQNTKNCNRAEDAQ